MSSATNSSRGERTTQRSRHLAATSGERLAEYRPGTIIADKYELERVIGKGGMGEVWRARNIELDSNVAIKLVHGEGATSEVKQRLMFEARAAARIEHPAIVKVFDLGTTLRGDPFIVMEMVKGASLAERMNEGSFDPVHAVQLLLPIVHALGAAHARGIVHRDVKPENIILSPGEGEVVHPKLVDFGIAKLRDEERERIHITGGGKGMGTPDYMAPEQIHPAGEVDGRADVWALSVVLYECIAGARPFEADSLWRLFHAVCFSEPKTLAELGVCDGELSEIIAQGLAKVPEERWPDTDAMGRALAEWALDAGVDTDLTGKALEVQWLGSGRWMLRNSRSDPNAARRSQTRLTPAIKMSEQVIEVQAVPTDAKASASAVLSAHRAGAQSPALRASSALRRWLRHLPMAYVAGSVALATMVIVLLLLSNQHVERLSSMPIPHLIITPMDH
jgi:serine/threonine protein kinase